MNQTKQPKIQPKQLDCLPPFTKDFFIKSSSIQKQFSQAYEYTQSDKLGQGSFGSVFKAKHKRSGLLRAVKMLPNVKIENIKKVQLEIDIMAELDHPHIVKLFETFYENGSFYLVMELCNGGDIFDKILEIGNFTEQEARVLFVQILRSLAYLQSLQIVHRDLKPENILFQQKNKLTSVYLIDFGLSCKSSKKSNSLEEKAGTIYYVAPEVLTSKYNHQCDVWSVGVLLYVLLCGYPPFYSDTEKEIMQLILKGEFDFDGQEWINISKPVKLLIKSMISDLKNRIQMNDIFRSEWIITYLQNERKFFGLEKALQVFNKNKLILWKQYSWLKKLALIFISSQIGTYEILRIKNAFLYINESQIGRITYEEVCKIIPDDQETKQLFREADYNQNNLIDYYGKTLQFLFVKNLSRQVSMKKNSCRKLIFYQPLNIQVISISKQLLQKLLKLYLQLMVKLKHEEVMNEGYHCQTPENIVTQYNGSVNLEQFKEIMKSL